MVCHVVVSTNPEERREDALRALDVLVEQGDRIIHLPVNASRTNFGIDSNAVHHLAELGYAPQELAVDFFHLAAATYVIDKLILRSDAEDGWTRDIRLYLPVRYRTQWLAARARFEDALSFLSGDRWTLVFRTKGTEASELVQGRTNSSAPDCVCLFSGGLDSCIGAIDLLESARNPLLVSHYGDMQTPGFQSNVYRVLSDNYGRQRAPWFQARVRPEATGRGEYEDSTRCRSIVFIALGVLAASCISEETEVIIPENGFMSLNSPLTPARLGSLSTRTTHPYFLQTLCSALDQVGLRHPLRNPYGFSTKGEMVRACANQDVLSDAVGKTMSCAHPSAGRWDGLSPQHCGYCVPCLVRRAALNGTGLDQPDDYARDVRHEHVPADGRGGNLRAVQIAIERFRQGVPFSHILKAGPLVQDAGLASQYAEVYRRGMEELRALLAGELRG